MKMRIAPRFGNQPNVGNRAHLVRPQDFNELLKGSRGMTNRIDRHDLIARSVPADRSDRVANSRPPWREVTANRVEFSAAAERLRAWSDSRSSRCWPASRHQREAQVIFALCSRCRGTLLRDSCNAR